MEVDQIIRRWQRAAERAQDERVRVVAVGGEYRATSSSHPLGTYVLSRGPEGWQCECVANGEYGMPCKHLWVLAGLLGLDLFADVRLSVPSETLTSAA
jgi:hypothetical protein